MFNDSIKFGNYEVIGELGEGAEGEVFKVRWQSRRGEVFGALKLLKDPRVKKILKEVSAWARVSQHRNILTFITADEHQGRLFIISELITEGDLGKWIAEKSGRAEYFDEAVEIMLGILEGLAHLHENDIIHRDIKPANIFLKDKMPLLADFGLARGLDLSQSTILGGTLAYMSPELINVYLSLKLGSKLKYERTELDDLWAVAVTFQQMLTGELPFESLDDIRMCCPAPISIEIPKNIRDFLQTAFTKNPSDRFQTAGEMRKTLAGFVRPSQQETIVDEDFEKDRQAEIAREKQYQAEIERLKQEAEARETELRRQIEDARRKAEAEKPAREKSETAPQKRSETDNPEPQAEAQIWEELEKVYNEGKTIKGLVKSLVDGGLRLDINGVEGLLPGSLIGGLLPDPESFPGKEIEVKIVKFNRRRASIICSHKAVLEEQTKAKPQESQPISENIAQYREKSIASQDLMPGLDKILNEIYTQKTVYIVDDGTRGFVLGPNEICGRVLGLIDPEYGWPVQIELTDVTRLEQIRCGNRRHPFICKNGNLFAVSIGLGEYEEIKQRFFRNSINKEKKSDDFLPVFRSSEGIDFKKNAADLTEIKRKIKVLRKQPPEPELKNFLGIKFLLIPAGEFLMGTNLPETVRNLAVNSGFQENDSFCLPEIKYLIRETPQRPVKIPHHFYMSKYLVTQARWEKVMGYNPSYTKRKRNPVENVTWFEAKRFIHKLNKMEGNSGRYYTLPTEAEWEYACRAGSTTEYFCGNKLENNQANFRTERSGPVPVGMFKPNRWGLYDMHGNVWEWCEDIFTESYENLPSNGLPNLIKSRQNIRVLRGGSWGVNALSCRSAYRGRALATTKRPCNSFRLVMRVKASGLNPIW